MALPDFLVIGAPKAGTTALHAALAGHPEAVHVPGQRNPSSSSPTVPRRGVAAGQATWQTYREHIWRREGPMRRCSTPRRPARCAASRPPSTCTTGRPSGGSAR